MLEFLSKTLKKTLLLYVIYLIPIFIKKKYLPEHNLTSINFYYQWRPKVLFSIPHIPKIIIIITIKNIHPSIRKYIAQFFFMIKS